MKIASVAAVFALTLAAASGPALAEGRLVYPDKRPYCSEGLCFVAGKPYLTGAYRMIACADPQKFLTYMGNRLVCKPR